MTRPLRLNGRIALLLAGLLVLPRVALALDTTQWKNEQALTITHRGATKLTLPPETLGAARAQLEDLRLLDPSGHETPFLIEHAAPTIPAATARPSSIDVALKGSTTEIVIKTGTAEPLDSFALTTPAPSFLKALRIETSPDGEKWGLVTDGAPFFRQFGAEQLRFGLKRQPAAWLRVTIDDSHSRPLPVTGAMLFVAAETQPAPSTPLEAAHVSRREEFAGETVLTIDLGASHIPLASLQFTTPDAIFTRKVAVVTREFRDETTVERTLATGTIYRLALDGLESTAQLNVPLAFIAPARELIVRIENGDSPPLAIDGIEIRQLPVWLVFNATTPGRFQLLAGNPVAKAPRYDFADFSSQLRNAAPITAALSPLALNPNYHPTDSLADTVLLGAAIDPSGWRHAKSVHLAASGVQQLELDPDVLAGTANDCADLRLVRDGQQVPYVLERPALSRTVKVPVTAVKTPQTPRLSVWELKLPRAGLPVTQLTLRSPTPLFQRQVRVVEAANDERTGAYDRMLTTAEWHRTPGAPDQLTLPLDLRPHGDALRIETDNGDNPPITLASAEVAYPVVRLLFKADAGPLMLYYGNGDAAAPRYDVALIANQLVAAEKNIATLDTEQRGAAVRWSGVAGMHAGVVFWGALALVVLALLVVVAKLLPKPPG